MHAVVPSPADRPKRGVSNDNLRAISPLGNQASVDPPLQIESADYPRVRGDWSTWQDQCSILRPPGEVP